MFRLAFFALAMSSVISGCVTIQQVAEIDQSTGMLPTEVQATVLKNVAFDLDTRKAMIVVTPENDFLRGQTEVIGYFDNVLNVTGLETEIIKNGLATKVPTVDGMIGLNNAANSFKPFVWLDFDVRREGMNDYLQITLKDAGSMEELFRAERHLDTLWAGVNDNNTYYPLFNALIEYIAANSES